jgi:hypothetical protein
MASTLQYRHLARWATLTLKRGYFKEFDDDQWGGGRRGDTMSLKCGHQRAYCSSSKRHMSMESHGGMTLTEKSRRTRRKICHSATLSTTNSTRPDAGSSLGLHGERLVTAMAQLFKEFTSTPAKLADST